MPVRKVLKWCVVSLVPPRSRALARFLSPRAVRSITFNDAKDVTRSMHTKPRGEERFHVADEEIEGSTGRYRTRLYLFLGIRDLSWNLKENDQDEVWYMRMRALLPS